MLWLMLILPIALMVLGYPFFLVLLASATIVIVGFTSVPPMAVPQIMFGSIGNFALLAVPFFIFAGELMGRGGALRFDLWIDRSDGRGSRAAVLSAAPQERL